MPRMRQAGPKGRKQYRSAKRTAWRKRRGIGESFGGKPIHYIPHGRLPTPRESDELPILIEDRAHADDIFPVTGQEVLARIRELPANHVEGITHVWLRRKKPSDQRPFGCCAYGPGYCAIILYPWPRQLRWFLGKRPPNSWVRNFASNYDGQLEKRGGSWTVTYSLEGVRRFFFDDLILHEVGHHIDWRRTTRANRRQKESFADDYAQYWARRLAEPPRLRARISKPLREKLMQLTSSAHPYFKPRFLTRGVGPTSEHTIGFELVDRKGRVRSNLVWIRPSAIATLTADGLAVRIERANQRSSGLAVGTLADAEEKGSTDA